MQDYEQSLLLGLLRRLNSIDANGISSARGTVRERSLNEQRSTPHMPGYYSFFCIHERHKHGPCRQCKRTQADGERARLKFVDEVAKLLA